MSRKFKLSMVHHLPITKVRINLGSQGQIIKTLLTTAGYRDRVCANLLTGVKADGRIDHRTFLHAQRSTDRAAQETSVGGNCCTVYLRGIEWRGRVGGD